MRQNQKNFKPYLISVSLVAFLVVFISSCASIVSKSEYPVAITSKPPGADITIKNRAGEVVYAGKTPATVVLKTKAGFFKGENYTVTFKKEGYMPYTAQIKRGVDGWYIFGNIFLGGIIGWLIVDPLTGAMWTLENLHVDLTPQKSSSMEQKTCIYVLTIDQVPDQLRSKLVRIN